MARPATNGHGKCVPPINETCHAPFPLSSSPPEGERDRASLREFHVKNSGLSPSLLLALLGSVLLHLGVLFGLPMQRPNQANTPHVIQARLVSAAPLAPTPETFSPARRIPDPVKTPPIPVPISSIAPAPTGTGARPVSPGEPPVVAVRSGMASAEESLSDPTYFPIEQLDEPPRLLGDVRQVYPARARNAGIEGFVILSLLINERGEVDEIHVVKSQPIGFFEDSAIAMLRGQRFTPAIKQGRPARSRWQKTVRFKLQGL